MRGGLFMEFINVKNEAGTTIINDSYDNLVYLSLPNKRRLYCGLEAIEQCQLMY